MSFDYTTVRYRSLQGRSVVITGGASGIGEEMVKAFVAQGARVCFVDIDAERGGALAASTDAEFHACDVTDIARLRQVLGRIEAAQGSVDVLVNNAGKDDRHAMAEVEPDSWRRALALNLDHQFFATQAVSKGMAERGRGSVMMLGSISWMRGRPGLVGYTTAKAAINGMTKTLARELGPSGIRVNCIVPGAILTERQEKLWLTPELNRQFLDLQALKFRLDASHVARLALFVASDESAGCTGANFIVDAGLTQN
jgi:NAD(P)-dependent dehydrogenase (short-subunit alcohol dehydrogenase family)